MASLHGCATVKFKSQAPRFIGVVYEPPRVWTQIDLRARQEEDTAMVSMALSIPMGVAAILLRHCQWTPKLVEKEWSGQRGEKLRKAVGLPLSLLGCAAAGPKELSHASKHKCEICFDAVASSRTKMISAGCSHYYCEECWRGYISLAVRQGTPCLSLRCPDPSCQAPVTQELVHKVSNNADRTRYAQLVLLSYVDDSGGRIQWCPGTDCGRALEFLGGPDAKDVVAVCECKLVFCWGCGEEPHRPMPCATARFWAETITSREDWVTKRCPKCRRKIENGRWTNHVTCSAPCCHRFCWICLHPLVAGYHTASCTLYRDLKEKILHLGRTKKEEHLKAVASSHYELWEANQKLLQEALQELDLLKRGGGQMNIADSLGITDAADLDFLSEAYEEIAECRRVIRWVYPFGYYYLDPKRDADTCEHFDQLQKEANISLDRLQQFAELDRMKLYDVEIKDMIEAYSDFKANVVRLTRETRHKVEMVVKVARQTDLQD